MGAYDSDCGVHSSTFDGGVEPGQGQVKVPGTLQGHHDNDVSAIGQVVGAPGGCHAGSDIVECQPGDPGCVLFLPIADGSSSSNPPILNVRTWGAFYVWCNAGSGSTCSEFVGQFIPTWPAAGGQTANTWTFGNQSGITVVHLTA